MQLLAFAALSRLLKIALKCVLCKSNTGQISREIFGQISREFLGQISKSDLECFRNDLGWLENQNQILPSIFFLLNPIIFTQKLILNFHVTRSPSKIKLKCKQFTESLTSKSTQPRIQTFAEILSQN